MPAKERIRKADTNKLTVNKKTEKADFRKSENRASEKKENCIIRITEKTEKQNADESIKNDFFTEKTKTMSKKKLIISSENASFFSTLFFLKSKNSERVKKSQSSES